jgi:hypothetical protein
MDSLITTLTVLAFAGAMLAAAIDAVIRTLRDANHLIDDICDQPGEENPQP